VWVLALAANAAAQEFPSKPVHLVVPFPRAGPLDISAADREGVGRSAGDTRSSSRTARKHHRSEYVVKIAPDGYTLIIISSTPLVTFRTIQKCLRSVEDWSALTPDHAPHLCLRRQSDDRDRLDPDLNRPGEERAGRLNYASGERSGQHLYVEP